MQMNREDLRRAYKTMRRIREFEDRVNAEFSRGEIPGFVHLYSGEEAIAVGVCMHLDDRDYIGSTHRGHGHCIAKGCDTKGMMLEIFGRADGLCGGKGGSMHIADLDRGMLGANAIVGGNPPLAIGAALSAKVRGTDRIAVSFTGDGGSNQGTVFEAMNMAVILRLPVVFVIENNGYGEGTGASYAVGAPSIAQRAAGFGMPAVSIDGTDFFAVHEAMGVASARARAGEGPSFIEAHCTRHHGHYCGDPQAYRSKGELETAKREHDPIALFRDRVTGAAVLTLDELNVIDLEIRNELDDAVAAAHAAPPPSIASLGRDVYARY
jgi:pyruvate dehydrogenase E1 component alpha subunit